MRIIIGLILLHCCAMLGQARIIYEEKSDVDEYAMDNTVRYDFNQNDFVRNRVLDVKTTYYVGEPVVLPIEVVNHTRFPVTLKTNFSLNGSLEVHVRRSGLSGRRVVAPFDQGKYVDNDFPLLPMESLHKQILIWVDDSHPSGLVFDRPGQYQVELKLSVSIPEGNMKGKLSYGPMTIDVTEPPSEYQPLLDAIAEMDGYRTLNIGQFPGEQYEQWKKLIEEKGPIPSELEPFYDFCVAGEQLRRWQMDHPDPETPLSPEDAKALAPYFLKLIEKPSYYQYAACQSLLVIYDMAGMAAEARELGRRMIPIAEEEFGAGRIGESKLIKRYLVNTTELSPQQFWYFFP